MYRPDWDAFFLRIAGDVALRGECLRRQVGAVVVKHHDIKSAGYNGFPAGQQETCLTGHCPRGQMTYEEQPAGTGYAATGCVVIHAEENALYRCDRADMIGATMYVSCAPCEHCEPRIRGAGIRRVVWPDGSLDLAL